MNKNLLTASTAIVLFLGLQTLGTASFLGTADTFAVLAGTTITNTGSTVVTGNIGVFPGFAVTGFPPGMLVSGGVYVANEVALQAQKDVKTAYNALAAESPTLDLTGQDLGGLTLVAGVYNFSSSAFLTGTLILDAQGDSNARFDFLMGSTLELLSGANIEIINGGDACNVFWKVGSSATLGTNSTFIGHILALTSVTMNTGATIVEGSAFARNGAVTLQSNSITACNASIASTVPGPAAVLPFLVGGLARLRRRVR